jgi:hypothetical protein
MGNHVIRDRIWASKKLGRCSREAAMAYPAIFLVADEWGRFEYRPHLIWSQVFGPRMDFAPADTPTSADVARWLSEYEQCGLLERYHLDGDLAHWTGFSGRPESKRRKSHYPDPQQFKRVRKNAGRRNGTGTPSEGDRKGTGRQSDSLARDVRLEQETRAGGQEQELAPPPAYVPSPDVRAETAIREARWNLERRLLRAVALIAERTGRDPPGVMREVTAYRKPDGSVVKGRVNPAELGSVERVEKSLEDAEAWLADLDKQSKTGT